MKDSQQTSTHPTMMNHSKLLWNGQIQTQTPGANVVSALKFNSTEADRAIYSDVPPLTTPAAVTTEIPTATEMPEETKSEEPDKSLSLKTASVSSVAEHILTTVRGHAAHMDGDPAKQPAAQTIKKTAAQTIKKRPAAAAVEKHKPAKKHTFLK